MHDADWNKGFVERHFDDLVNRKDLTAIDRNFAPDFVDHDGPDGAKASVEEGRRRFSAGLERFPDLRVEIRDLVAEGDRVAVRAVWYGTDKASGQHMEMHGFTLWRIADGRFVERWAKTTPMSPLTSDTFVW